MPRTSAHIRIRAPRVLDWQARLRQPPALAVTTLGELADLFLADRIRRGVPYNTLRTLRSALNRFRLDFGSLLTVDAEPAWFMAWIEAWGGDRAPKTIRKDLYFFGLVFDFGVEMRLATRNPIRELPRRALPRNRVLDKARARLEVLELPDVVRLLACETILWDRRLLWAVLLSTGLRSAEASGLSFGDWHPVQRPLGELLIHAQWIPATQELAPTKTDLVRHVPVSTFLEPWLRGARARFEKRHGYAPIPGDILIPFRGFKGTLDSRRWSPKTSLRWWHRDLETAGIPHPASGPRRVHATRHTFATRCVQAGADWRAVAEITHNPSESELAGCAFGQYVHLGWPYLCAAIEKLRF